MWNTCWHFQMFQSLNQLMYLRCDFFCHLCHIILSQVCKYTSVSTVVSLLWYTHYIFKLLHSSLGKSQILTNDLLPSQKNAWSGSTQQKTQFNKCMHSLLKQYILGYSLLCTQLLQGFWMMICGNPHIRFETWNFIAWCFNYLFIFAHLCVWCDCHENDFQFKYIY